MVIIFLIGPAWRDHPDSKLLAAITTKMAGVALLWVTEPSLILAFKSSGSFHQLKFLK